MVLMRYAHLPAATTSQQSAAARTCFVVGDHLRHASGVTGQLELSLGKLVLPEVFEAVRRQDRVADRGHDRSMAEIGLDGASVMAVVSELETAGMPQHY